MATYMVPCVFINSTALCIIRDACAETETTGAFGFTDEWYRRRVSDTCDETLDEECAQAENNNSGHKVEGRQQ